MGWMRTLLLGDVGNRLDIEDTERDIAAIRKAHARAKGSLADSQAQITALRAELGRQKLAIEALTRFLVTKKIVDEGELEDFIAAVDAEDGVVDGKLAFDRSTGQLRFIVPRSPKDESAEAK